MQTLLHAIVGSRGLRMQFPCSDLNLRSVVYGEGKSPNTELPGFGTHSTWPLKAFIGKILTFNYEALEMLFADPQNILRWDPILTPLWNHRPKLLCFEMVDALMNKANRLFKKAVEENVNLPNTIAEVRYDIPRMILAFNLIRVAESVINGEGFKPQVCYLAPDWILRVLLRKWPKRDLKYQFQQESAQIRDNQFSYIRAPSQREVNRGETPVPRVPTSLTKEVRVEFLRIAENIEAQLASGGDRDREMNMEDWRTLLRGSECRVPPCFESVSFNDYLRITSQRRPSAKTRPRHP